MLQKIFNSWEGAIEIDGTLYNNASEIDSDIQLTDGSTIILRSNRNNKRLEEATGESKEYHFVVKKYMTKKSTASFDFMKKWNKDIPMPMVITNCALASENRYSQSSSVISAIRAAYSSLSSLCV